MTSGLHELLISLDGITSETSAAIRGSAAADIDTATNRVHELLAYKEKLHEAPKIVMQFVKQKNNAHEADAWYEYWSGVSGIDNVRIKSYIDWNGDSEKIKTLRIGKPPESSSVICDKPWMSVVILWDGTVVPCCFDYDGLYKLGDATRHSLSEIWKSQASNHLRNSRAHNELNDIDLCRSCVDKKGLSKQELKPYSLTRIKNRRRTHGHID